MYRVVEGNGTRFLGPCSCGSYPVTFVSRCGKEQTREKIRVVMG